MNIDYIGIWISMHRKYNMYLCALLIVKCVCLWVNRKDVERVGKESVLSHSGIEG